MQKRIDILSEKHAPPPSHRGFVKILSNHTPWFSAVCIYVSNTLIDLYSKSVKIKKESWKNYVGIVQLFLTFCSLDISQIKNCDEIVLQKTGFFLANLMYIPSKML